MRASTVGLYFDFLGHGSGFRRSTFGQDQANALIDYGEELNAQSGGCCSSGKSGYYEVQSFMDSYGDKFESSAKQSVQNYLGSHTTARSRR